MRKSIDGIAPEALAAFRRYEWPGNVRELRNVIERAMILEDEETITTKYLPRGLAGEARPGNEAGGDGATSPDQFRLPADGVSLEEVEMSMVRQALKRSGGNQTKAAELLDISRDQLRYRIKKLDADAPAASEAEQ
jgi:DNA-binding NtrC family response regulator